MPSKFYIYLTFFAAFSIEILGSTISVIGLSSLVGLNIIFIALVIVLDLGKIMVVSSLYNYWKKMNLMMKAFAFFAAFVTIMITSGGAAGYLSAEFQKGMVGSQEIGVKVSLMEQEQTKLLERKKEIDSQISKIPDTVTVKQRVLLMKQFKDEQVTVTDRLAQINKDIPELKIKQINSEAKTGPIIMMAKAFNVPVEQIMKYIIIALVGVFDPLAVYLIVLGNFLLKLRNESKEEKSVEEGTEPQKDIEEHIQSEPIEETKIEPEPGVITEPVIQETIQTLNTEIPEVIKEEPERELITMNQLVQPKKAATPKKSPNGQTAFEILKNA